MVELEKVTLLQKDQSLREEVKPMIELLIGVTYTCLLTGGLLVGLRRTVQYAFAWLEEAFNTVNFA